MDAHTSSILATVFGILGNIISFLVFLSPLPTFYTIYETKSTQEFQSIPYSVGLFSAMLYLYYAFLKTNALLLITINSIGCVINIIYLVIFITYATAEAKVWALRLVVLFNLAAYGLIVGFSFVFSNGLRRTIFIGWICAGFSISVFASPLANLRRVVRTRSVEFMPFLPSFFLTLCAVTWFVYGLLIEDYFVAAPNVLGFLLGLIQMILYAIYKDGKASVQEINLQRR